jgi:hypothetical protein|tara:strand:- start:3097 stop:3276 length:180 start_codon:yes stop_codon:yes gene_type:complete
MSKIDVSPASWQKVFALVGKLIRYAKGGFTKAEKQELLSDLFDVLGVIADDIGEDIGKR